MLEGLPDNLPDSQTLLAAAKDGDASALWRLTQALRPHLKRMASKTMGHALASKVDESDLAQLALSAAFSRFDQFEGQTLAEWHAWLLAIARHETLNTVRYWQQQRRDSRREVSFDVLPLTPRGNAPNPKEQVERRERAAALLAGIQVLSESDQRLIEWRHFMGLTHAEIATQLGISEAATRQRWRAAIERLRRAVRTEDD